MSPIQLETTTLRPGDPAYRQTISDDIYVRWATPADRAGILMTGAIAIVRDREGKESESTIRQLEKAINSDCDDADETIRNYAIAVSTKGPCLFPRNPGPNDRSDCDTEYVTSLREAAGSSPEPVLATLNLSWMRSSFDQNAGEVKVGKLGLLACRTQARGRKEHGGNVVNALMRMYFDRTSMKGAAFNLVFGIKNYYKLHGFDYAYDFGPFWRTTIARVPDPLDESDSSGEKYILRHANPSDFERLLELSEQPAGHASFWLRPDNIRAFGKFMWRMDENQPLDPHPDIYRRSFGGEMFVLESLSTEGTKIVAAATLGMIATWSRYGSVTVTRVCLDERESFATLCKQLVTRLVPEAQKLLDQEVEKEAKEKQKPAEPKVLASIGWIISRGHPFVKWLRATDLGEPDDAKGYDPQQTTCYLAIPDLVQFATSLTPVLNTRLSKSRRILGSKGSFTLRICTYSSSKLGVAIGIENLHVTKVEPFRSTGVAIGMSEGKEEEKANVLAPNGALVQMLMGFKSWQEIKRIHPDVKIDQAIAPVYEVCFPVLDVCCHGYV